MLTTRTAHWFIERGFAATDVEPLPDAKRELYSYQRRSKVLAKGLRRRSDLSSDLHFALDLDRYVERQFGHADRTARMGARLWTEQFEDKV